MIRGSRLVPALALLTLLGGCRASAAECEAVGAHVAELAAAEGKGNTNLAAQIEADCKEQQPTRALLKCMQGATSLAELDDC